MQRDVSVDKLKAFALMLMVFDHVGFGNNCHIYIQSFHMPLFFIMSGYLWKDRCVKESILRKAKSLLIPYCVFGIIFYMMLYLVNGCVFDVNKITALLIYPTDMGNMPIAPALWYLYCAFIAESMFCIIRNAGINEFFKFIIIGTVSSAGFAYSSLSDSMLPFAMEPTAAALLFLYIGSKIRKYRIQDLSIVIGIAVLIIECLIAFQNGSVDLRSARYHNVIMYITASILGTFGYWIVANKINNIYLNTISKFIASAGMVFICLNQFFIAVFNKMVVLIGCDSKIISKITIFICTMLALILVSHLAKNSRRIAALFGRC